MKLHPVEAINRHQCKALLRSEEIVDLVLWFDADENECLARDAQYAETEPDSAGNTYVIDLADFEERELN